MKKKLINYVPEIMAYEIGRELTKAMIRNPSLTLTQVIYQARDMCMPGRTNLTNAAILECLVKYNKLRDQDASKIRNSK